MNITGRVTADAKVHNVSDSKTVVHFWVALNDSYKNKAGERIGQETYFDCAYWLSPNLAEILKNGTVVELTGKVSARGWRGSDGQPHAGLNFNTWQIKLHSLSLANGRGGKKDDAMQAPTGINNDDTKDDLPF